MSEPPRPFVRLPELPDDLAESVEALKLSIRRHQLAGWSDVRQDDVLQSLWGLVEFTLHAPEARCA